MNSYIEGYERWVDFIEGSHYQLFVTKKIVYWPIAKSKG